MIFTRGSWSPCRSQHFFCHQSKSKFKYRTVECREKVTSFMENKAPRIELKISLNGRQSPYARRIINEDSKATNRKMNFNNFFCCLHRKQLKKIFLRDNTQQQKSGRLTHFLSFDSCSHMFSFSSFYGCVKKVHS